MHNDPRKQSGRCLECGRHLDETRSMLGTGRCINKECSRLEVVSSLQRCYSYSGEEEFLWQQTVNFLLTDPAPDRSAGISAHARDILREGK